MSPLPPTDYDTFIPSSQEEIPADHLYKCLEAFGIQFHNLSMATPPIAARYDGSKCTLGWIPMTMLFSVKLSIGSAADLEKVVLLNRFCSLPRKFP